MKSQLKLFDIPFNICNEQQLYQESCDFLEEFALYTIFFVAAEQCIYMSEANEQIISKEQTIWVPGDDALRSLLPKRERHDLGDFSVRRYIMQMCEYAVDMGLDICFLMENEKDLDFVIHGVRKSFPYLAIHGLHLEMMQSAEMMVNEINSIAPEILILGIHTGELRRYMEYDRTKTNARLCICVGNLLIDEMSKKNKLFHTITMSRRLKKRLHKYSKGTKRDEAIRK